MVNLFIVFFVIILIILFSFLIIYQFLNLTIEGLENSTASTASTTSTTSTKEYQNYSDDPLILAKQNAANIEFLKNQMSEIKSYNQTVIDLSNNYVDLYNQVQGLSQQQIDFGNQLNGGSDAPIVVSGTNTTDEEV
jgi:hypothetical protein